MFLQLCIPDNGKFVLEFDNKDLHRFTMCKFWYQNGKFLIKLSEDYIYVFIEDMLGCINKKIVLDEYNLLGKMGKWQECFYYDSTYLKSHSKEIELMEDSIFVSTELYGTFLYEFNKENWIEINRGYNEKNKISPLEYYNNPEKYRILLAKIPQDILNKWRRNLSAIKEKYS